MSASKSALNEAIIEKDVEKKNIFKLIEEVKKLRESFSKSIGRIGKLETKLVELTTEKDKVVKEIDIFIILFKKRNLGIKQLKKENNEQKEIICSLQSQLVNSHKQNYINEYIIKESVDITNVLLQKLIEAQIAAVLQHQDDAKKLKQRYNKEMDLLMARLFYEATKHVELPPEK